MAAYTLFEACYRVARELGIAHEGTVTTAGSVTTTIDNIYLKDRFGDDHFKSGTIFVLYDAAGLGGAPQKEWARVTDFAQQTGTITHTALTVATNVGDRYAVCGDEYTLDTIIQSINIALSELQVPYIDTTTITTDSNKTEYVLPTSILDQKIKVWIQRSTTTNQNLWIEYHDWYVGETTTNTAKTLIFRSQPPEPWKVKIEYYIPHPAIYTNSAVISEIININRLSVEASLRCLLWKKAQKSQVDPVLDERIQFLMGRMTGMQNKYPMPKTGPKLATLGSIDNFR